MPAHKSKLWGIPRREFIALVERSTSVRHLLDETGMPGSGAYRTVRERMEHEGLDYLALKKRAYGHARRPMKIPLKDILVRGSSYRRHNLKRRLLEENLLRYECAECGRGPKWRGKVLVLVLDHINGVSDDHRLENLRFLCPNCNSQTPAFAGRNNGAKGPDSGKRCEGCGTKVWRTSTWCRKCAPVQRERKRRKAA